MAFDLTKAARLAKDKVNLEPQLVLEIDGVPTRYGVRPISKKIRIGDPGLVIGDDWKIGGSNALDDQEPLISLNDGTTTTITQQLDPSKGSGSSVSSMQVALVDQGEKITRLITPGEIVDDILGRRTRLYLGLQDTSFPEDYVTIFRGIIDDIQARAGSIVLNLAHPDQKKRQTLFTKQKVEAVSVVNGLFPLVTLSADDRAKIVFQTSPQSGLTPYLRYGDELIGITGNNTNTVALVDRAQLGTTQNTDTIDSDSTFETFYMLEGNIMDLALRLMLSDKDQSAYVEDVPVASVVNIDIDSNYPQSLFFREDVVERYGVSIGDRVYVSGTTSNNLTTAEYVTDIIKRVDGTVVTVTSNFVTLTPENPTNGVAKFVSQYNMLGIGLGMKPDEVDIAEHLKLKRLFLSGFEVRFYMKDEVNLKEFIEQELYAVAGAFSTPRKSKASVGLHIGPIPGSQTAIITRHDVKAPAALMTRRSLANNFTNTVIYKFDEALDNDEFQNYEIVTDEDSINQIKVGTKAMIIESRGLRSDLNGSTLAKAAAQRRLNRYKFGAEYLDIAVTFKRGFNIEIGDIVLLDGAGLKLLNSKDASRNLPPKFFEVVNKRLDMRGDVVLSLVDTNFSTQFRYGKVSPASKIRLGISQTKFIIETSFGSTLGTAEYLKWAPLLENGNTIGVTIRSPDSSTRYFETTVKAMIGNEVEVTDSLGFTPAAGDIMEFATYDYEGTSAIQKALYAYVSNGPFDDGSSEYVNL